MPTFSVVVPVYNRPSELAELLESLASQVGSPNLEIIIVEDGSQTLSDKVAESFASRLNISYVSQANTGPAIARNNGALSAHADYVFFFDSDCTLPSDFFSRVEAQLSSNEYYCVGTPDHSHPSFTPLQKAISYSMTSLFTTGGIRGGSKKMDVFYPRSYSMCIRSDVFRSVGGFAPMRYGEDIDLSMRIREAGYTLALIADTYVYHKRRTTFRAFFKQTFCSGTARIDIASRHVGALKLVHALPTLAVALLALFVVLALFVSPLWLLPLVAYAALIFVDSLRVNKSPDVALLSIITSAIQIVGYGLGFIYNFFVRHILRRSESVAFQHTLYK